MAEIFKKTDYQFPKIAGNLNPLEVKMSSIYVTNFFHFYGFLQQMSLCSLEHTPVSNRQPKAPPPMSLATKRSKFFLFSFLFIFYLDSIW
jgi:hypothetical protein